MFNFHFPLKKRGKRKNSRRKKNTHRTNSISTIFILSRIARWMASLAWLADFLLLFFSYFPNFLFRFWCCVYSEFSTFFLLCIFFLLTFFIYFHFTLRQHNTQCEKHLRIETYNSRRMKIIIIKGSANVNLSIEELRIKVNPNNNMQLNGFSSPFLLHLCHFFIHFPQTFSTMMI